MKILIAIVCSSLILIACAANTNTDNQNNEPEVIREDSLLSTGWYSIKNFENDFAYQLENDTTIYFIDPLPIVSVKHFSKLEVKENQFNQTALIIWFDKFGSNAWYEGTKVNVGRQLALIIDNKLVSVGKVNEPIPSGVSSLSSLNYDTNEILEFKSILEKEMGMTSDK